MTENLYEMIMTLLRIGSESAANELGWKGKPYNHFEEFNKYAFNIKKQDKTKFEEIHKRLTGDAISFEEIIKETGRHLVNYTKLREEQHKKN